MLRLLTRRATVQLPLLFAVVAMVTIGATLLGVCALLLTVSQDQALNEGLAQAEPDDVSVIAYVIDVNGKHTASVAADARTAMATALAPFPIAGIDVQASSVARPLADRLGDIRQVAYLSAIDGLHERTRLTAGRWPRTAGPGRADAPVEAAVLEATARRLGLSTGDRVRLGPENTSTDPGGPLTVKVVGIVRPVADAGWDRDPLAGAGYDPDHTSSQYPNPSAQYGPFIVEPADLWASGATLDRMQVSVQPDLSHPTGPALERAAAALTGVDRRLQVTLSTRVGNERVVSALPATLSQARFQQDVTRSTVLVVVLLGTVLTAAALALAGRLMVSLRSTETALFSAMGAGRGQLAAQAATEALILAALATVLAVPLSSLAHFGLTHLPRLADAGLAAPLGVTVAQVATVLGGALILATVLVVPALRPDPAQLGDRARDRPSLLIRSGADLLLLALAAAGWWQLRSQPAGAAGTDAVRVVAPVLCLLAGAAVALRLITVPLRVGERLARRSRGLVLPLAVFEAARRPRAVAAGLLLALAAATGTFGLAFGATWERSQHDQAAVRVGTDLAVSLLSPARPGQGAAVADATGGTISAVTDRNVTVGRWTGDVNDAPRLVAVDARKAGPLLRGRLPDGQTWAHQGEVTAPDAPVTGAALTPDRDVPITLTGTVAGSADLQVTPRLVVQDRDGLRFPCDLPTVRLDGHSHPLRLCDAPTDGSQIVAVHLTVEPDATLSPLEVLELANLGERALSVRITVPAATGAPAGPATWTTTPLGEGALPIAGPTTTSTTTADATVLRTRATLGLARFGAYDLDSMSMVITPFKIPFGVPAVVSQRLTDQLGVSVDDPLKVMVGTTEVTVIVAGSLPTVPSAAGKAALLVDSDTLSRALIVTGDLEPAIDAWWVGSPSRPDAAARADELGLGSVVTRAEVSRQLSSGPLRVGLPASLLVLIPAVVLLVLAGTIMHVTSDVDARAVEIARLRGLGLTRRSILRGLMAQHGGMLALLLGGGALVGVVTSVAVAPLLVRSDVGAAPVPAVLTTWPWSRETALLAVLLIGSTVVVSLVVSVQLRRADAAHLRVGA